MDLTVENWKRIGTSIIFASILIAKFISKKTNSIDLLWFIILWVLIWNLNIIPSNKWIWTIFEFIWEIGIIFIMFSLWFEENFWKFKDGLKRSRWIVIFWALFPFWAAFLSAFYWGFWLKSALIRWITMTATAVSLSLISLKSRNFHKSTAATWIMTAAVTDSVLSLIWLSVLIPIIISQSYNRTSLTYNLIIIIFKVLLFFGIIIFLWLFIFPERKFIKKKESIRRKFTIFPEIVYSFLWIRKWILSHNWEFAALIVVFIIISISSLADILWFHTAIWAYFAWLFLKNEYFLINPDWNNESTPETHIENMKTFIDIMAFKIFWPVFFIYLWTKLNLYIDVSYFATIFKMTLILFISVFICQILSAWLSAKFIWWYKNHESIMIWIWMLGRAELAFIVINMVFIDNHLFNNQVSTIMFTILMFTVFLLNISVPLTIRLREPYYKWEKTLVIFWTRLSR